MILRSLKSFGHYLRFFGSFYKLTADWSRRMEVASGFGKISQRDFVTCEELLKMRELPTQRSIPRSDYFSNPEIDNE